MRLGCDLDGVLADLNRAFTAVALRRYPQLDLSAMTAADVTATAPAGEADTDAEAQTADGEAPSAPGEDRELSLSRRQLDETWDDIAATSDFWETLEEIESGAIARLAALADTHRWEVIFLTSRPRTAGRLVQLQSQRWLAQKGFPIPSVYVVHKSRGRISDALALDVLIDDRPENCLDVALESKARPILVWRGPSNRVPGSAKRLGIGVVTSVNACLDLLVEAEREASAPLDLVHRLKRLLGLGPRAATK
jgi:hypothetical protein